MSARHFTAMASAVGEVPFRVTSRAIRMTLKMFWVHSTRQYLLFCRTAKINVPIVDEARIDRREFAQRIAEVRTVRAERRAGTNKNVLGMYIERFLECPEK